jgi:hypothetical protein
MIFKGGGVIGNVQMLYFYKYECIKRYSFIARNVCCIIFVLVKCSH